MGPIDVFDLDEATAVLRRTPRVLRAWLRDLPEPWTTAREESDGWTAFDVVGHLIHGERTDWIPRLLHILDGDPAEPFAPFDRFAMFEASRGRTLAELLDELEALRAENLGVLTSRRPGAADLERAGTHPELGRVTARQLLATWAAHDLSHIAQVARILAKRYREAVGPWRAYLPLLDR